MKNSFINSLTSIKLSTKNIKPLLSKALGIAAIVVFYAIVGCPTRYFFGICCPGCGMTRAAFSILRLDFIAAFNYHPLIFIMPVCAIIFLIRKRLSAKLYNGLIFMAIVLFTGVYVYRLINADEYVYIDISQGFVFRIIDYFKSIL